MSSTVIVSTAAELRNQREELLRQVGLSYDQLKAYASDWQLTDEELSVWRTIEGIDFLLGDDA